MGKTWRWGAASMALAAGLGLAASAQARDVAERGDAANSTSTQMRINAGDVVTGALSPAGDTDWYRLAVRPGMSYQITLEGAGDSALDDPYLVVHDASGGEIASNDDFGEGLNSRIDYVSSERGNVFIEAKGFSDDATGSYRLAVVASPLPPDDAGDGTSTRARLELGAPHVGSLDFAGDKDWYRVRLAAGQSYRVRLNGAPEADDALGDPMVRVLDASGEEVASDDDSGGGLNSYLEITPSASGDFFIEARSFDHSATGKYEVSVSAGDIPGDANTDVSISADGDSRSSTIGSGGDHDWYKIELVSGQTVRIALDGSGDNALSDPLLTVHSADGEQVAQNDDAHGSLNSYLEFSAPSDGTYFIDAGGFGDDSTGEYTLSITAGEIGATTDSAEALDVTQGSASSVIGTNGDSDWFSVQMVEGRPYRFTMTSDEADGSLDPFLTLYDGDGKEIASDDDGGQGVNAYLSFTSPTGGTYYVAASSFGGEGTGAYTVTVKDTEVPGNTDTDEVLSSDDRDERVSAIEFSGDKDHFKADLSVGVSYTITVSGNGPTPLADPVLTVRASDGTELTSDDDSGPGRDARLVFRPTASDTYFFQVNGTGAITGGYKITLARNPN